MAYTYDHLEDAMVEKFLVEPGFTGPPVNAAPGDGAEYDLTLELIQNVAIPLHDHILSFAIEPGVIELTYQVKTDVDDPVPGFLENKVDDNTIKVNTNTHKMYVAGVPLAGPSVPGGVAIGAQPYLYMQGNNLMVNVETNTFLVGGNDMIPTSRAVKVYVDNALLGIGGGGGGGGDMLKSTYDTALSGVVDDADRLGNQLPAYYLAWANFTGVPTTIGGYGITDAYTQTAIDAFFEGEDTGKKQVDWARITNRPTLIESHGNLTNLLVDDHTQYPLLTGRNGDTLLIDTLGEFNTGVGVTIDGVLLKDSGIQLINAGGLDQYGKDLIIGSDWITHTSRTDATIKSAIISTPHYTNAEQNIAGIYILGSSINNLVSIGGGESVYNAATRVSIYAGATTTTLTGTKVADFSIDGFSTDIINELTPAAGVTLNDDFYLPNITGSGTANSILQFNRATGAVTYGDETGGSGQSMVNTETLTDNAITYVIIGDTATDIGIKLLYSMERSTSYQGGSITVVYKGGTTVNIDSSYLGDPCGEIIQADVSGTDIRLKITLSSTGNNATLKYIKEYEGGYNQWWGEGSPDSLYNLPEGTTSDIVVGETATHRSVKILYALTRGTDHQVGEHLILFKGGTTTEDDTVYHGDAAGITFASSINNGYIIFSPTIEAGSDGVLEYRIIYPDGDRDWAPAGGVYTLTEALVNNSSNTIYTGNTLNARAFKVIYSLTRSTSYQTGEIYLVHDGTAVTQDWSYIGDSPGVTITSSIVDDQLLLDVALDASGSAGTFDYQAIELGNELVDVVINTNFYLSAVNASNIASVDFTITGGSNVTGVDFSHTIESHSDVTLTTITTDDFLKWSGTAWVNEAVSIPTQYWSQSGGNLSPLTATDDILLPFDRKIKWGTGTDYLYMQAGHVMQVYADGNYTLEIGSNVVVSNVTIRRHTAPADLGTSTQMWGSVYSDNYYIETIGTRLYRDGSDNLTFTDIVTGTKTLAELAAGGGSGTVTNTGTLTDNYIIVGNGTVDVTVADATVNFAAQDVTNVGNITLNAGADILRAGTLSDVGSTSGYFNYAYFSRYLVGAGYYMTGDGTGNLTFTDPNNPGGKTLTELAGAVTNYWQVVGTDIKPATTGYDMLLDTDNGERLRFGISTGEDWIIEFPNADLSNTGLKYSHDSNYLGLYYNNSRTLTFYMDGGGIISTWHNTLTSKTNTLTTTYANVDLDIYSADGVISSVNGQDINISSGDPYNSTGADAGDIYLIAAAGRSGDATSDPGNIYISPGYSNASGYGNTIIGDPTNASTGQYIITEGTGTSIPLYLNPKGGAGIYLGSRSNVGPVRIHGLKVNQNGGADDIELTRSNENIDTITIDGGQSGSVAGWEAGALILKGGNGYDAVGFKDGADVFIYGGQKAGTGVDGDIFLGTGSAGALTIDNSGAYLVVIDITTGKLSYREVSSLP